MGDSTDPAANPFGRVVDHWDRVLEDMAATAEQYRAAGRTVIELHPGDVAVLTGDPRTLAEARGEGDRDRGRVGFDVVVPGEEFERLRDALADRTVDAYRVFRERASGVVFLLIALESGDDLAALVPAYYDETERDAIRQSVRERGMYTHVRALSGDEVLTVEHADPAPFFDGED